MDGIDWQNIISEQDFPITVITLAPIRAVDDDGEWFDVPMGTVCEVIEDDMQYGLWVLSGVDDAFTAPNIHPHSFDLLANQPHPASSASVSWQHENTLRRIRQDLPRLRQLCAAEGWRIDAVEEPSDTTDALLAGVEAPPITLVVTPARPAPAPESSLEELIRTLHGYEVSIATR